MKISRRKFLAGAAITGVTGLVAPSFFVKYAYANHGGAEFNNRLAIPPLLKGVSKDGVRVFELNLQHGLSEFFKGKQTPTSGINGAFLGPTIQVNKGDKVRLNVTNKLTESSTLHWHGLHLPAKMDGGPHQAIEVGKTWSPEFEIRQNASTQWYHSHAYHRTAIQVYAGLAGLFYIKDEQSDALNLPSDYGLDDIPIVIQDRAFKRDGRFHYGSTMHTRMMGMTGNYMLVNGTLNSVFNVQKKLTRLRLLNGSNARIYNLAFSDGRNFKQIATDGGLLSKPVEMQNLRLAPGERAEIIVQFSSNENVMLINQPIKVKRSGRAGMMGMMNEMSGGNQPFGIMRLESAQIQTSSTTLAKKLAKVRNWDERDAVKTRLFELQMQMGMGMMMGSGGGLTINGKSMDMNRIDEVVQLNDIEIWQIVNRSSMPHPFHIHDIQFRILDRNGKPPPANEQGLKDTVLLQSGETVRVITQFEHYADAKMPYMYHCHILEHEEAGMMGQFVVVNNIA